MKQKHLFAFLLITLFIHSVLSQRKSVSSLKPLVDSFEVYTLNRILASDFDGRLTGDSGYTKAAQWAASKFQSWGVKPYDQAKGFLQSFPAPFARVKKAELTITLPPSADTSKDRLLRLEPEKDFFPLLFTDSGTLESETVFIGWGIHAPELGYDDYAGIDVRGKIVLCFRGVPWDDSLFTHHDEHRTRMETAKEQGALSLIYIYDEASANPNGDLLPGFCPAEITFAVADQILAERGWKAASLRDSLAQRKKPISFALQSIIRYSVESEHHPNGIGYNVIGYIEGTDPLLRKECIIMGAHLDHCGTHLGKTFQGANDNASGSALVMALAKLFAEEKQKPKRSLVFILFGGEETGLLGSAFYAEHVPAPFQRIKAMLNFDMVGEGDGGWCGYSADPGWVKSILDSANSITKTIKGSRAIHRVGVRSSDFAPFFKKGIPCLSFGSNGPHLFYHQTGDTIYRINPDILADITRVGFLCAIQIANL